MGNLKLRWTVEEEQALNAGVAKHGTGKWSYILKDPEFKSRLAKRSNVDLKDKWRNLETARAVGITPGRRATASSSVAPKTQSTPGSISKENDNNNPVQIPEDAKSAPTYSELIFEALSSIKDPRGSDRGAIKKFIEEKYEVPLNFKKSVSSKLSRLVVRGKLEKVENRYKIKDTALDTKTPIPETEDNTQRTLEHSQPNNFSETVEDACKIAAALIADAEYKELVAAKAVKEAERVSQMAEEAEAVLMAVQEMFEQC